MKKTLFYVLGLSAFFLLFAAPAYSQGVLLRASGAVNESMGSAATAAPIDSLGALFWNPASISGLKESEISFGLGLILPHSRVASTDPTGTYSGSTKSEAGSVPAPSMGFVWRRCPKSKTTFGLGIAAIGGAATLYEQTPTNTILGGHMKQSNIAVFQLTPTVSYQLTDRLSVGVSPLLDMALLNLNPMPLGRTAGDDITNYGTRYVWGGGFQVGFMYDFKNHFKTGFMFKSPIWAESVKIVGTTDSVNVPGRIPANGTFDLDLPMTLSWGFSYDGFRNTLLALDVRYFDYGHTNGFKEGIDATGTVKGLGWESVMSVAIGAERSISEKTKIRMGYCWNENPIPNKSSALNVAAPMSMEHTLSFGGTYTVQKGLDFSVAYSHVFEKVISGPFPIYNAGNVRNTSSADCFVFGITKRW